MRFHHPVAGALVMSFDDELSADAGLTTAVHTAEPGSSPHDAEPARQPARTLDQAKAANVVNRL